MQDPCRLGLQNRMPEKELACAFVWDQGFFGVPGVEGAICCKDLKADRNNSGNLGSSTQTRCHLRNNYPIF